MLNTVNNRCLHSQHLQDTYPCLGATTLSHHTHRQGIMAVGSTLIKVPKKPGAGVVLHRVIWSQYRRICQRKLYRPGRGIQVNSIITSNTDNLKRVQSLKCHHLKSRK